MCTPLDTIAKMQGQSGSLIVEFLFHGAACGKLQSRAKTTKTTASLSKVHFAKFAKR